MKAIGTKLVIAAGLLVAVMIAFSPQALPGGNRVSTPPVVQPPKPVVPPPGVKYLAKVEDLVFAMTNRIRQTRGLAPLSRDDELRNVARAYSDDMLVRRFFDHTTPDGVPFYIRMSKHYPHWVRAKGENIWGSWGLYPGNSQKLAKEIVADWMSSPDHRENMLDPDYTHLGVGVSVRRDTILATQEFVGKFKAACFEKGLPSWFKSILKRVQPAI
jgi:uncharacterized protein YkwD